MKSKFFTLVCISFFAFFVVFLPPVIHAQGPSPDARDEAKSATPAFLPLVGIPGIQDSALATTGFGSYINALYRLSISIAALLAVIKIVAAGAKYMLSDIVTHKEDAKKDIQGALLGLLVIIGAVVILTTINTDITKNTIAVDPLTNFNGSDAWKSTIQDAINKANQANDLCNSQTSCQVDKCDGTRYVVGTFVPGVNTCKAWCDDLKGVLQYNGFGREITNFNAVGLPTCTHPPIVEGCDINSGRICCEDVNKGTWYGEHNMCLSPKQGFTELRCGDGGLIYDAAEADCATAKKICTDGGNQVLSIVPADPNSTGERKFYGSLLCSSAFNSGSVSDIGVSP